MPQTLELTSTTNPKLGFWPRILAAIPILKDSIPPFVWFGMSQRPNGSTPHCYEFVMGLAPFLNLPHLLRPQQQLPSPPKPSPTILRSDVSPPATPDRTEFSQPRRTTGSLTLPSIQAPKPKTSSSLGHTKYHLFLSLRVRGIIHPIPAYLPATEDLREHVQPELAGIAGWRRIVMVMYKPSTRYLVQVLERAMGDFGEPFMQMVPSLVQTLGSGAAAGAVGAAQSGGTGAGLGGQSQAQPAGITAQQQSHPDPMQPAEQAEQLAANAGEYGAPPTTTLSDMNWQTGTLLPTAPAGSSGPSQAASPLPGPLSSTTPVAPVASTISGSTTAPSSQPSTATTPSNSTSSSTSAQIEEALKSILEQRVNEFENWYRRNGPAGTSQRPRQSQSQYHNPPYILSTISSSPPTAYPILPHLITRRRPARQ